MFTYEMRPNRRNCSAFSSEVGFTDVSPSRVTMNHQMREGLELLAAQLAVQARAGLPRVLERDLARAFERAGRGDADERSLERPPGEGIADDRVLAGGED